MKKVIFSLMLMGSTGMVFSQATTELQTAKKAELNSKMQKHWNDMKKELNLSPDQEEKIKVLHENEALEMKQMMSSNNQVDKEKMKQEMKARHEQTEVEMQKILSPEQYSKLKSMMDKKSAKLEKKKSALLK
jgi:protein CpxP